MCSKHRELARLRLPAQVVVITTMHSAASYMFPTFNCYYQVEYYFSDSHLQKDQHLLSHIGKDPDGFGEQMTWSW